MPVAASSSKRQRVGQEDDDDGDRGHYAVGASAVGGALAALVEPTAVIPYRPRPQAASTNGRSADRNGYSGLKSRSLPLAAFPLLPEAELTDGPRKARRRGYSKASRWLSERVEAALQRQCQPLADELGRWISSLSDGRCPGTILQRGFVPVASISVSLSSPTIFSRAVHSLQRTASTASAPVLFASLESSDAARDVSWIIEKCCQMFSSQLPGPSGLPSSNGAMSAWRQLRRRISETEETPLLVLILPQVPSSPFWSTLSFLLNQQAASDSSDIRIAVIVASGFGPSGMDGLSFEERRGLDVQQLNAASVPDDIILPQLLIDIQQSPLIRLPPVVFRYISEKWPSWAATPAGSLSALQNWIELALQLQYTSDSCTALLDAAAPLSAGDFSQDFLNNLKIRILDAVSPGQDEESEPAFELLPAPLASKSALSKLLQSDQFLLDSRNDFLDDAKAVKEELSSGLTLLKLLSSNPNINGFQSLSKPPAVTFDSLDFALATTSSYGRRMDASSIVLLRKGINDALTPHLRQIRRSETEGGMPLADVEELLERVEDWAEVRVKAISDERDGQSATRQTSTSVSLTDVRALRQKLQISSTSRSNDASTPQAEEAESETARVLAVDQRLRLEETLRTVRKEVADWLGQTIRSLLIPPFQKIDLFHSPSVNGDDGGTRLVATVESLLTPSPRTHTTLCLSRPQVYLETFAQTLHRRSDPTTLTAAQTDVLSTLQSLYTPAVAAAAATTTTTTTSSSAARAQTLSTDLSIGYNLLREAGGAGTGVRGRMINVYDWYLAWKVAVQSRNAALRDRNEISSLQISKKRRQSNDDNDDDEDASQSVHDDDFLQPRFALVLSTLAMFGYIKKTRKTSSSSSSGPRSTNGHGHGHGDGDGNGNGTNPGRKTGTRGGGSGMMMGEFVLKVGGWDKVLGEEEDHHLEVIGGPTL